MESKNILASFHSCLRSCNLDPMTKDLYKFFSLRCGFIAHYNLEGFRGTYSSPEDFLMFCSSLKANLEQAIDWSKRSENYTDNTDSFKWDYNFNIPEVKLEMLGLLNSYSKCITTECNNRLLENLQAQRRRLNYKIDSLKNVEVAK